jgi:GNAT superfamily N-acetyltransferase
MTPFVDRELARQLERAEGEASGSFADARARLDPRRGATRAEIGGALLAFDGPESPVTQGFALGLAGPVGEDDLATIEAFFASRGAPTNLEMCPLAGAELFATLAKRGYRPIELSNVLVRGLDDLSSLARPSGLVVRAARDEEAERWTRTSAGGWSASPEEATAFEGFARLAFANKAMTSFFAERDGAPIATAAMGVFGGIALLAGASTLPSARGHGAQRSLLAARLDEAKRRGCTVAMMATAPGSISQQNAERNGFRVVYTRTKWQRA